MTTAEVARKLRKLALLSERARATHRTPATKGEPKRRWRLRRCQYCNLSKDHLDAKRVLGSEWYDILF